MGSGGSGVELRRDGDVPSCCGSLGAIYTTGPFPQTRMGVAKYLREKASSRTPRRDRSRVSIV
jgi:hypothetical protein